jgi:hypothetical protein
MSAKPISHLKGKMQTEGFQEQGAEESIWISREKI